MKPKALIAAALLAVAPAFALADKAWYSSEDVAGAPLIRDVPPVEVVEVCGEDCVGEPVVVEKPSIGNKHAVLHGELSSADGGQRCRECHTPFGEAIVKNDTMLCSQYAFVTPGLTIDDPVTGLPAREPVTGELIVSGDGVAILHRGDEVLCTNCHNPHRRGTDGSRPKVEDFMIHAGCLDCHVREGNSDVRRGAGD